jgi:hypothetical protein
MEKVKALIGLLIIAAGFYYAWNMIPPHFHNSQFQDDLDDVARRTTYTSVSDDDIKKLVIRKAENNDIILKEDQIIIERVGPAVTLSVHYRVHVDLKVYQTDLDFVDNSHNKMIGT